MPNRKKLGLLLPVLVLALGLVGCATQREAIRALGDTASAIVKTKPAQTAERQVSLVSDKPNTQFSIKRSPGAEKELLGTGQTIKASVPSQGGYELFVKAPGYKEKSNTIVETIDPIRFVFLEEERVLTIRSDIEGTEFRIRPKGQTRWQPLGKGKVVEYWVPREGQFEVEARPAGHAAQVLPVIDRTGELTFSDFTLVRQIELVSSEDYTRFLLRDVRNGAEDWEYVGVGKSLKVQAPAGEAFEVSAKPLYHREKRRLVSAPTAKVEFDFSDADKEGSAPPAPVMRGETIVPRPLDQISTLKREDLSKVREGAAWQALLIGVNDYSGAGGRVRNLSSPVNDVNVLGQVLSESYGFGAVTILRDRQATRKAVEQELLKLHSSCSKGGNLLIYYAGHGTLQSNGAGVWVLADGEELPNSVLKDFIQRFPARRVLLVSDSCYSGEFLTRDLRVRYQPQAVANTSKAAEPMPPWMGKNLAAGRQVLTSGNLSPVPDTSVGYCQDHSPFSCALITALKEGVQPGGVVGVTDLYAYICDSFQKKGVTEDHMPQRGALAGDEGGEFFFVRAK